MGGSGGTVSNSAAAVSRLAVMERLVRASNTIADSLEPFDASNAIVQVTVHFVPWALMFLGGESGVSFYEYCEFSSDCSITVYCPASSLLFTSHFDERIGASFRAMILIFGMALYRRRAAFWERTAPRFSS